MRNHERARIEQLADQMRPAVSGVEPDRVSVDVGTLTRLGAETTVVALSRMPRLVEELNAVYGVLREVASSSWACRGCSCWVRKPDVPARK